MLLRVHARHAEEEVALQAQGNGSAGWLLDRCACPGDVDPLDGLSIQLAVVGEQPVADDSVNVSWSS